MKKDGWLFASWFIAFYLLVNFSFTLPNEYNGQSVAILLRGSSKGPAWNMINLLAWFVFSCIPWLILQWQFPKNKWRCAGWLLPGIVAAYFFRWWVDRLMMHRPLGISFHLFRYSYFIVCFTLYPFIFFAIRYAQRASRRATSLQLQQQQAELSFLRAQVNPHFLFNSLNNIYALVFQQSAKALPAIAGFSEILRYMLYESTETVPLEKEISYIKKYTALQMLRFEVPVNLHIEVNGPVETVSTAPLLFIPFVENAFKHGALQHGEELRIIFTVAWGKIFFECHNCIAVQEKDAVPGIGIANVKRRLALLYPDLYSLKIQQPDGCFVVKLEL